MLVLFALGVRFVDVNGTVQATQFCGGHITHAKVGVERFLETEGRRSMGGDNQLKAELFTKRGAEKKVEIAEPGFSAGFVKSGGESDSDVVVGMGNAFQLPGFCAHQAVRGGTWVFCTGGKPRETHRR